MIGLIAFLAFAAIVTWTIVDAYRARRRPPSPEDGCCGCGAKLCDALVGGAEGYCWTCIDTWPATGVPLAELGLTVFPGRERGPR